MTKQQKRWLAQHVKARIKDSCTDAEIVKQAEPHGFTGSTIRKYIKAFRAERKEA